MEEEHVPKIIIQSVVPLDNVCVQNLGKWCLMPIWGHLNISKMKVYKKWREQTQALRKGATYVAPGKLGAWFRQAAKG